jgi:Domain of unknown function (DUF4926)
MTELDLAVLTEDLPSLRLQAGDVGTVVFVHERGRAYEVEFAAVDGRTIGVETLTADQVSPLSGRRILHVRDLASA